MSSKITESSLVDHVDQSNIGSLKALDTEEIDAALRVQLSSPVHNRMYETLYTIILFVILFR